jgi:hypothetical protein
MIKYLLSASLLLAIVSVSPAPAQSTGTAAKGDSADAIERKFQNSGASQVKPGHKACDRSQQLGTGTGDSQDTKSTKTKDYPANSGGLEETSTALIAPDSVSPAPIGRQAQTLGFKDGVDEEYIGPYRSGGQSGGTLPYTSTAAVDIDVINGGSSQPAPAPQFKSNKLQWGSYQTDDAAPQYGMEDPYGFFGD